MLAFQILRAFSYAASPSRDNCPSKSILSAATSAASIIAAACDVVFGVTLLASLSKNVRLII
jgi:hypothetical protein